MFVAMGDSRKIRLLLLFTTLMLFKVSALHVYVHQDESRVISCHWCEQAVEQQQSELLSAGILELPELITLSPSETRIQVMPVASFKATVAFRFYTRPPPCLA